MFDVSTLGFDVFLFLDQSTGRPCSSNIPNPCEDTLQDPIVLEALNSQVSDSERSQKAAQPVHVLVVDVSDLEEGE